MVIVCGTATAIFLLAARRYLPAVSGAGVAGSSLPGWTIRAGTPSELGDFTTGFDLAGQAGLSAVELVAVSALNSALLLLLATGVAVLLGVPLGFWLAIHAPRGLVAPLKSVVTIGAAFPAFFIAFLLQVLAVEVAGRAGRTVLPVYGFGLDAHLVIPVTALSLAPLAYVLRLVAITASDVNAREFVRTARSKGLSEGAVVYRHVAPNMLGVIGEAGLGAARFVLGGLVIVEYLLAWPGLGLLVLRAANVQDLSIFLAAASLLGALLLATEIALDFITDRTGVQR